MTDPQARVLLQARIKESGLSARQFAMQILHVNERTVRRYLAGGRIPAPIVVLLQRLAIPEAKL